MCSPLPATHNTLPWPLLPSQPHRVINIVSKFKAAPGKPGAAIFYLGPLLPHIPLDPFPEFILRNYDADTDSQCRKFPAPLPSSELKASAENLRKI